MSAERRAQKRVILYRAELPHSAEPYEVVYEAVADALHFACRDLRTGRRRPVAIVEDGVVVLDAEGIAAECESRNDDDWLNDADHERSEEDRAGDG